MTGYRIEIGYNSAGPTGAEAWESLKAVALEICGNVAAIAVEVTRLEPSYTIDELHGFVMAYADREDLTVTFHDEPAWHEDVSEFKPYISQLASGGGASREVKEACRRAFCRMVIEAMHRRRIEVNLRVS